MNEEDMRNKFCVDMSKYKDNERFTCIIGFMDKITVKDFLAPHKTFEGEAIVELLNDLNVSCTHYSNINLIQQKKLSRLWDRLHDVERLIDDLGSDELKRQANEIILAEMVIEDEGK